MRNTWGRRLLAREKRTNFCSQIEQTHIFLSFPVPLRKKMEKITHQFFAESLGTVAVSKDGMETMTSQYGRTEPTPPLPDIGAIINNALRAPSAQSK